ncbi:hypothetical protein VTK73DRAFT_7042 [Phialemonium thermophilum]|uniref:Myb-like domain-containing protein n=1 Tax=Phialemonium thermophilum TaxID=223376 RepID=A0ABR3WH22_9PEZI
MFIKMAEPRIFWGDGAPDILPTVATVALNETEDASFLYQRLAQAAPSSTVDFDYNHNYYHTQEVNRNELKPDPSVSPDRGPWSPPSPSSMDNAESSFLMDDTPAVMHTPAKYLPDSSYVSAQYPLSTGFTTGQTLVPTQGPAPNSTYYHDWPTTAAPAAAEHFSAYNGSVSSGNCNIQGEGSSQWHAAADHQLFTSLNLGCDGLPRYDMDAPMTTMPPPPTNPFFREQEHHPHPSAQSGYGSLAGSSFSSMGSSDMMGALELGEEPGIPVVTGHHGQPLSSWSTIPGPHSHSMNFRWGEPTQTSALHHQPIGGGVSGLSASPPSQVHRARAVTPLVPILRDDEAEDILTEHTVSPKLTRIHPTPSPKSSSDSSHGNYLAGTATDSGSEFHSQDSSIASGGRGQASAPHAGPATPGRRARAASVTGTSGHRSRRKLPARVRRATRHVSPTATYPGSSSGPRFRTTANMSHLVDSQDVSSSQAGPSRQAETYLSSARRTAERPPHRSSSAMLGTVIDEDGDNEEPERGHEHPAEATSIVPSPPPPALPARRLETAAQRAVKDDFLVKCKLAGMPYKEIRRKGGFTEAESTLRGRFRTLTKHKQARVRKPEWSERDVILLERAVRSFTHGNDPRVAKIPWKKVAGYIVAHGGTYLFGNSTCRKRWDELVAEQTSRGKDIRQPFFEMSDQN